MPSSTASRSTVLELLSYFFLLVVAGNETTRNATTGGVLAFIDNPDQWKRLQNNPALLNPAIEEIVRWTSPVIQFARTATEDTDARTDDNEGDSVALYLSVGESRRRRVSRSRSSSTSRATPTRTSRLASASISASVRTSRGSNSR